MGSMKLKFLADSWRSVVVVVVVLLFTGTIAVANYYRAQAEMWKNLVQEQAAAVEQTRAEIKELDKKYTTLMRNYFYIKLLWPEEGRKKL